MASTHANPPVERSPAAVVRHIWATRLASLTQGRVLLIFTTVLATLFRLHELGVKSLWNDEIISVGIAERPLGEILRARLRIGATEELIDRLYTNNPPLHLLILHVVNAVSQQDFAYRLPFALAGIAAIPVTYRLIQRLFRPDVAFPVAMLVAVSPLHISYSQEARPTAFLFVFSLLSLGALLDAVASGKRSDWTRFVIYSTFNIWMSYFALILVMPTLGVILLISLRRVWRELGVAATKRTVFAAVGAFGFVALAAVPLLSDILATSDMNSANVQSGFDPIHVLVTTAILMLVALPIPGSASVGFVVMVLVIGGLLAVARARNERSAISLAWLGVPFVILGIIQSNHVLELRYVLFMMPFVFAAMMTAIFDTVDRLAAVPVIHVGHVRTTVLSVLVVLSFIGMTVPARDAIAGQPIKVDWKSVATKYAGSATSESCLIVVDGTGHAMFGIMQHYLDQTGSDYCAVDGRDPRLFDLIADRTDIWWAVGTQFHTTDHVDAMLAEFAPDAVISEYFLALLIHPDSSRAGESPEQSIDAFLRRSIAAIEPAGSVEDNPLPIFRESLANLLIVKCGEALPAATIVSLLGDYTHALNLNDDLARGRAEGRLQRGNIEGARALGIRLVGLSPGDPTAYDFLAAVERSAGRQEEAGYAAAASALRSGLKAVPDTDFIGC